MLSLWFLRVLDAQSKIFRVLDGPDVRDQQGISAYFVQMGQFIDHDITLSPELEDLETNQSVVSVPLTSDTFHSIKFPS